jgi:hypothetical protein
MVAKNKKPFGEEKKKIQTEYHVPDIPPPSKLMEMLCRSGIPMKEEYRELLRFLQVPVVWDFIFEALSEAKELHKNEIDNYFEDREK